MACSIFGWRHADTTAELGAEATQTRKSDLETDLRHRLFAVRQQSLRPIQPASNAQLVRSFSEERRKLADEQARGHASSGGDLVHRRSVVSFADELVTRRTQGAQLVSCQHAASVSRLDEGQPRLVSTVVQRSTPDPASTLISALSVFLGSCRPEARLPWMHA